MAVGFIRSKFIPYNQNRRSYLIVLTISGVVFLISAILGFALNKLSTMLVIGAIGAIIFGLIAFFQPVAALTLLVATSATSGLALGTGTSTAIPLGMIMVMFLTGLWILKMVVIDHQIRLTPSPLNKPLLGFLIVVIFSWAVGYLIWDWKVPGKGNLLFVQIGQFAVFACSVAAVLLTANHALSETTLKAWVVIIIGIGIFGIIYQIIVRSDLFRDRGLTGSILMWPFVFLWAQLLFNPNLKPWMRIIGWSITPVWIYWFYNIFFMWKGGWVPALLALVLLIWFKSRRIFIILLLFTILIVFLNLSWVDQQLFTDEFQTGSSLRPLLWYDVIRMTSRSYLLGLGPANYILYWQDPTFIPLSRIASGWEKWNRIGYTPPSHSMFIDIFAQTGILGFILFTWAIIAALGLAYNLKNRLRSGFLQSYAIAVFCGFLSITISSFVFADWLIPFVYNITLRGFSHSVYSWLLLGTLVPIYHSIKDHIHGSVS